MPEADVVENALPVPAHCLQPPRNAPQGPTESTVDIGNYFNRHEVLSILCNLYSTFIHVESLVGENGGDVRMGVSGATARAVNIHTRSYNHSVHEYRHTIAKCLPHLFTQTRRPR